MVHELLHDESDLLSVAENANECFGELRKEFPQWAESFIPLLE